MSGEEVSDFHSATTMADVSVIILAGNEEANIAQAIASVAGWARRLFVLDSYSTDRTVEIARSMGATVAHHEFRDHASQRNAALDTFGIDTEWVFFLDADEWLPDDLKREIAELISTRPIENGFFVAYKAIWFGTWIRRGYFPTWLLRLFRNGKARCEARRLNEHLIVEGRTGFLKHAFVHEDRKGLRAWVDKHRFYAKREAAELLNSGAEGNIDVALFGTQAQQKRWLRYRVWNRLPPLVRPLAYFAYRAFLRGGVLDGPRATLFHVLQALWYPMLIDIEYLKLKRRH